MIKCLLCNSEFERIDNAHIQSIHGITSEEYLQMFPDAETCSVELRQRISDSLLGSSASEEARRRMSTSRLGHFISEETKRKISASLMGHPGAMEGRTHCEETRRSISESQLGKTMSEESRKLMSEAHTGKVLSDAHKQAMSEAAMENWKDPEFQMMMSRAWNRRPNEDELHLQAVLDRYFLGEWKYVGDGQIWIGGKNPDFININGKKQVIELFSLYWHDPDLFPDRLTEKELVVHYKQYGFDCLVVWDYHCDKEVVDAVKALAYVGRI